MTLYQTLFFALREATLSKIEGVTPDVCPAGPGEGAGVFYGVLSTRGAPGAVFMTALMPLSLAVADEYSSLVPMISPFVAVSTKYGLLLVAVFRTYRASSVRSSGPMRFR
jgi:hypothetical protein